MKLLVMGREGQVARALAQCFSSDFEIFCIGRPEIDLQDRASVKRAVAAHQPDVVVNPAAYTAVDRAESEPELAYAINRDGAGYVAAAAEAVGVPVIHLSTDYVFSGEKTSPYAEIDEPDPQSVYGASKLAGERAVSEANPAHTILRTAWVYAPWGHNFAKTMLRLAQDRDVVRVVADQHGTPTYAPDIASGILTIAGAMMANPGSSVWRGVFHLTNGGETTWAGFAEAVFACSRANGGPWAKVEPIATEEYPTPAKRPGNSRLETALFNKTFARNLPQWHDGVERFIEATRSSRN